MTTARDVIATGLQNMLRGSDGIKNVPQTVLADAIIAALHAAGFKVVAREPSQKMRENGWDVGGRSTMAWRAMWDAAEGGE